MSNHFVVVADSSRARFFTLEPAQTPELESGPNLIERGDVKNFSSAKPQELWSDNKTGRNRGAGASAHGYDDHRDQHSEEYDRRFARQVTEQLVEIAKNNECSRVIVAAGSHMLGHLRSNFDDINKAGLQVEDIDKDLCKLSPNDIHSRLSKEGVLPAKKPPSIA